MDEGTKPNSRIQSTQPTADLVMLTIQTVTYEGLFAEKLEKIKKVLKIFGFYR